MVLSVLLGWSLALLGAVAAPDSTPDWLQWDAPPSCPDAAFAKDATGRRLGREVMTSDVSVVAAIERHDGEHQLDLRITRDATLHTHRLTAQDCRTLAEAVGLLVAVGIDPIATVRNIPSAPLVPEALAEPRVLELPEPSPRIEPVASASISSVTPAAPPKDTAPRPVGVDRQGMQQLMLAVFGGVELGALPALTGGPRLRLALGWERWRLELGGSYFAPRTATTTDGAVRVQLGTADVRACWRFGRRRVEVPLCGGLEAGASRAEGLREPTPRSASGLWLAPSVSGGVHGWVLPNLALVARAEIALSAVRTAYDVRNPGEPITVFAPGLVSGRLWLGVEVKLWSRR